MTSNFKPCLWNCEHPTDHPACKHLTSAIEKGKWDSRRCGLTGKRPGNMKECPAGGPV